MKKLMYVFLSLFCLSGFAMKAQQLPRNSPVAKTGDNYPPCISVLDSEETATIVFVVHIWVNEGNLDDSPLCLSFYESIYLNIYDTENGNEILGYSAVSDGQTVTPPEYIPMPICPNNGFVLKKVTISLPSVPVDCGDVDENGRGFKDLSLELRILDGEEFIPFDEASAFQLNCIQELWPPECFDYFDPKEISFCYECYAAPTGGGGNRPGQIDDDPQNKIAIGKTISIYPNPITNHFDLQINAERSEVGKIEIVHLMGHSVLQQKVAVLKGANQFFIDMSEFSPGTYIVKWQSGSIIETEKILKVAH